MVVSIADVFSASTRHIRQGVRERIFSEYHLHSVRHTIVFALLGVCLWGADWFVDPNHAKKALLFRLACLAVLLFSALFKWLSKSLYINYFVAYSSLALCEVGFLLLLNGLNGGLGQGAGQFLYFFLGTVLFCTLFPINYNMLGCIGLTIIPHAIGEIIATNFPHTLFASLLWPACALTILIHWRIRMLVVERQKLLREIESSVVTDPVTGLLNARGLGKAFQRLGKLAKTKTLQQFLLLIEIDGFDGIKAAHGQGFTHSLLGKIGEIIEVSFRGRDLTANLSENEFACILPNLSREEALELAERLRGIIEETSFDCLTSETGKLSCTISIGIVSADVKEEIKALLNRAQIGIDQAKSMGGNHCVCI